MKKAGTNPESNFNFPKLSLRQQTLLAIQLSKHDGYAPHSPKSIEQDTRELSTYLEDETRRYQRSKLLEEACKVFKPIRRNLFLERKPVKIPSDTDWMICECKAPYALPSGQLEGRMTVGCGQKCFNRLMSTECIESLCRLENTCTNRRFQAQEHLQIYPLKTQSRGWGLAAGQKIRKGQFVIQYMGEIYYIDSEIGRKRLEKYKGAPCTYLMSINHNEVIDPTKKGNIARFINHSCDPNCETQKWNVLGEVRIGIFAKRDIEENEELTFDYRFDTLKTALSRCLCGSAKCRKYLGVIQMELIAQVATEMCVNCEVRRDDDYMRLILCEECGQAYHIDCIVPKLQHAPEEPWFCSSCAPVSKKLPQKKLPKARKIKETAKNIKNQQILIAEMKSQAVELPPEMPERKFTIGKPQMNIIRAHLEEVLAVGCKMLWTCEKDKAEITLRDGNTQATFEIIMQLLNHEPLPKELPDTNLGDISDVPIVIPVVYLRRIVGPLDTLIEKYHDDFHVNVHYDTTLAIDLYYSLEALTTMYITGYKKDTEAAVLHFYSLIDSLTLSTINLHETACRSLAVFLVDLKKQLYPVDIRIASDSVVYESSHPFYTNSRSYRKVVLIGNGEEVENAEKVVFAQLSKARDYNREEEFVILQPIPALELLKRVKRDIARVAVLPSDIRYPDIKIPDSKPNARCLPIELAGTWDQILRMQRKIEEEVISRLGAERYAAFAKTLQPMIYSMMLKETANYIHLMEKRYFYLTPQEKKVWTNSVSEPIVMKHWDFITCEVFSVSSSNATRREVIREVLQNDECRVHLLRVAKDEAEMKFFLAQIGISARQALETVSKWFAEFSARYSTETSRMPYHSSFIDELASYYDFSEGGNPVSASKLIEEEIHELSKLQQRVNYPILPLDYGFDTKALLGMEHLPIDVQQYFSALEKRALIPAEDSITEQQIEVSPPHPDVMANADVVISCAQREDNMLYVVFAEKAKRLKAFPAQDHIIS